MSKTWNSTQNKEKKGTASYHMYSDGHSYWGLGLVRNGESPIKCTANEHCLILDDKIKWYLENSQGVKN